MTNVVRLDLDLSRPEGRAAMRAYLDAIEAGERSATLPPVETWPRPSFQEVLYRAFNLDFQAPATAAPEPAVAAPDACPEDPEPGVDPAPQDAPEALGGGDPERPWTDDLKREVWAMSEAGLKTAQIAGRVGLRPARVQAYLGNVRKGLARRPAATGGALVPVPAQAGAVALRDPQRHLAQDPQMQAARLEAMAEAERMKAVAASIYPEMRP